MALGKFEDEGASAPIVTPAKPKPRAPKPKVKKGKDDYADKGKWAEAEVQGWLDARLAAVRNFWYHRYPDARAARGALAPQPADFEVSFCWGSQYDPRTRYAMKLEVKETKRNNSLPLDKVGQYGKLKMAWWSGVRCFVVVYRSEKDDWTWLSDYEIFQYDDAPTSFVFDGKRSFPTAAAVMNEIHRQLTEER